RCRFCDRSNKRGWSALQIGVAEAELAYRAVSSQKLTTTEDTRDTEDKGHQGHKATKEWKLASASGRVCAQVDRRVPIEEVVWPQPERLPHRWRHRQVLGARQVVHSQIDPHHDVLVADRPIVRGPHRQAIVTMAAEHVLPARIALVRTVW